MSFKMPPTLHYQDFIFFYIELRIDLVWPATAPDSNPDPGLVAGPGQD